MLQCKDTGDEASNFFLLFSKSRKEKKKKTEKKIDAELPFQVKDHEHNPAYFKLISSAFIQFS